MVLCEVRRVARQLEADRNFTMSRAPQLLRELHETLVTVVGDMLPAGNSGGGSGSTWNIFEDDDDVLEVHAFPKYPRTAAADMQRNEARVVTLA